MLRAESWYCRSADECFESVLQLLFLALDRSKIDEELSMLLSASSTSRSELPAVLLSWFLLAWLAIVDAYGFWPVPNSPAAADLMKFEGCSLLDALLEGWNLVLIYSYGFWDRVIEARSADTVTLPLLTIVRLLKSRPALLPRANISEVVSLSLPWIP